MTKAAAVSPAETEIAGRARWLALGALCMGNFMIFLDTTIVNVALPSIQRNLHASISDLQWLLSAYTLVVAALLVTGGRLGDLFGRKRVVLLGVAIFAGGSAMASVSQDIHFLIAARAIQGLGGAMLLPGTLSIIANMFHGSERGLAIGVWSGLSGLAIALGPVLGGVLVEKVSWESIFYINVPLGLATFVVAWRVVQESRDETVSQRVDVPGVVLLSAALMALCLGLVQGNSEGWGSPFILGSIVVGLALLPAFVWAERRSAHPLLDLRFFRSPTFSGANFAACASSFGTFSFFFFITLYMQDVLGYSPVQMGVRLLPQSAMVAMIAPVAGKITARFGSRTPLAVGQTLLAVSLLMATRLGAGSGYGLLLAIFIVNGIGVGLSTTPLAAAVMGAVARERSGAASGVMNTMRQIGGTLGVAALGALFTHQVTAHFVIGAPALGLDGSASRALGPQIASSGARAVAALPGETLAQATALAKSAFVSGLSDTVWVNASMLMIGALVALLCVRKTESEPIGSRIVAAAEGD